MAATSCSALLLFGATGDLSRRMLLPSLYALHEDGLADVADGFGGVYTDQVLTHPRHAYTQALLRAVPPAHPSQRRDSVPLQGETPSPMAVPPGCASTCTAASL